MLFRLLALKLPVDVPTLTNPASAALKSIELAVLGNGVFLSLTEALPGAVEVVELREERLVALALRTLAALPVRLWTDGSAPSPFGLGSAFLSSLAEDAGTELCRLLPLDGFARSTLGFAS